MRKNPYFINILHVAVVGVVCLLRLLVGTFFPATVLPRIEIPFLVILSVIPLVMEHYLEPDRKRQWLAAAMIAGAAFALLPVCSGWNMTIPIWKLFAVGTLVFGITDLLYGSIGVRISSGPCVKLSPLVNGIILFLASQCLQGLL